MEGETEIESVLMIIKKYYEIFSLSFTEEKDESAFYGREEVMPRLF